MGTCSSLLGHRIAKAGQDGLDEIQHPNSSKSIGICSARRGDAPRREARPAGFEPATYGLEGLESIAEQPENVVPIESQKTGALESACGIDANGEEILEPLDGFQVIVEYWGQRLS